MGNEQDGNNSGSFNRFKELTNKLVQIPKKEIDKKEAAYQRKKARKKPKSV
jgi:hypothetical protein